MIPWKLNLLILLLLFSSCSDINSKKKVLTNKNNLNSPDSTAELSRYNLDSENPAVVKLPKELTEISGVTMTPDGRLFGEQDENGFVYQIDIGTGNIIKRFSLGNPVISEDFEDIDYANNKFYLLKSNGNIYEFKEGKDGEAVDYKIHKTGLNHSNDVEGLCYDIETNSLLLACKGVSGTGDDEDKAVYSFSLDSLKLNPAPRFLLPLEKIKKRFNPSGIQRHPKTGTFFIIAANGNEIIEVTKQGDIIDMHSLPRDIHIQPEGITFTSDLTLLISNEGKDGKGYIVIYPYLNK